MIVVTREEADELRTKIKGVHITKTCRLKNKGTRGKYYAEPTKPVLNVIAKIRECELCEID